MKLKWLNAQALVRLCAIAFGLLLAIVLLSGLIAAQSGKTPKLTADDYVEIQQLYADYTYALDQGDGERLANDFVEGGEFTGVHAPGRKPTHGREELIAMGNRGAGTRTYPTNLLITRTAEGAKASCYFVQYNVKDDPPTMGKTAIYEDTLVKTAQGWKFRKRISWSTSDELSPYWPKTPAQGKK
jgi:hypothetical protein